MAGSTHSLIQPRRSLFSAMSPGQPVADLENYMGALQRKIQSLETMTKTLDQYKGDEAKQYLP